MVSGQPAAEWLGALLGSFRSILVQGSSAGVEAGPGQGSGPRVWSAGPAPSKACSVVLLVPEPQAELSSRFWGLSRDSAGTGGSGPGLSASEEVSVSLGARESPLPLTSSPKKQPALGTKGTEL